MSRQDKDTKPSSSLCVCDFFLFVAFWFDSLWFSMTVASIWHTHFGSVTTRQRNHPLRFQWQNNNNGSGEPDVGHLCQKHTHTHISANAKTFGRNGISKSPRLESKLTRSSEQVFSPIFFVHYSECHCFSCSVSEIETHIILNWRMSTRTSQQRAIAHIEITLKLLKKGKNSTMTLPLLTIPTNSRSNWRVSHKRLLSSEFI